MNEFSLKLKDAEAFVFVGSKEDGMQFSGIYYPKTQTIDFNELTDLTTIKLSDLGLGEK